MIIGPSGSGKEMVARAIHASSARSGGASTSATSPSTAVTGSTFS